MTSIQERLQLKRVPLDKWSIKEQLCLASAVACSGDQNWMSVSRSLKMLCPSNRPSDWFAQRSCAAQYGKLLENVETPKRKKRTISERDNVVVETPGEMILKKLAQERVAELKKQIFDEQQEYMKIKDDVLLVQATTDETTLTEMWNQIELEIKQKEKERYHHGLWLKEREEKKLQMEKQWRPLVSASSAAATSNLQSLPNSPNAPLSLKIKSEENTDVDYQSPSTSSISTGPPKSGTSPLLTSLLKSPSSSTTNTPATTNIQTTSAVNRVSAAVRNIAPTISNLLTTNIIPELTQTKDFSQIKSQTSVENINVPPLSLLLDHDIAGSSIKKEQNSSLTEDLIPFTDLTGDSQSPIENDPNKEDEQQLLDVFNGLIPDNIDELADILTDNSAIMLSPELLEEESILENVDQLIDGTDVIDVNDTIEKNEGNFKLIDERKEKKEENFSLNNNGNKTTINSDEPKNEKIEKNSKNDDELIDKQIIPDKQDESTVENINPLEKQNLETKIDLEIKPGDFNFKQQIDSEKLKNEIFKNENTFEDKINPNQTTTTIPAPKVEIKQEQIDNATIDNRNDEIIEIPDDTSNTGSVKIEIIDDDDDSDNKMDIDSTDLTIKEDGETNQTDLKNDDIEIKLHEIVEDVHDDNSKTMEQKTEIRDKNKDTFEHSIKNSDSVEIVKSNQSSVERNISSDDDNSIGPREIDDDNKVNLENDENTNSEPQLISLIDTDDDSPIEVIKEDKSGKTKRDYSRKKTDSGEIPPDSPSNLKKPDEQIDEKSNLSGSILKIKDRERSESPLNLDDDNDELPRTRRRYSSTPNTDSVPNSPASSEDREQRAWKKAILVVYNRLTSHKYSSLFYKIEDNYYNYRNIILRHMDLQTIKRNIDSGTVKTTSEFQRDIMLMCTNVLMLNSSRNINSNYSIAKEFMEDAISVIDSALEGWKKEDKNQGSSSIVGTKHMRSGRKCSRMSNV